MKYRTRIRYTETDKALMWERWRQGKSLHAIARLFDRYHSVVGGILSRTDSSRIRISRTLRVACSHHALRHSGTRRTWSPSVMAYAPGAVRIAARTNWLGGSR